MSIQDLGALGELIGGIAVVASVIYLAIQIRHGIDGYRSNAIFQATNHFSNLQLEIAKDRDLLHTWHKAEKGEALDPLEQRQVLNIISSYLIGFENLHAQTQTGMLEQEAYEARRIIIASLIRYPGAKGWWDEFGRAQFPKDFADDVDQCVKDFG